MTPTANFRLFFMFLLIAQRSSYNDALLKSLCSSWFYHVRMLAQCAINCSLGVFVAESTLTDNTHSFACSNIRYNVTSSLLALAMIIIYALVVYSICCCFFASRHFLVT